MFAKPLTCVFVLALAACSWLDARPRRLANLGESNNLTEKRFNAGEASSPREDSMFGDERIKFEEWHGSYSTLGERRADQWRTRGGEEFRSGEVEFDTVERQRARIALESDERKLANVQNWNRVRENVMSHHFSGTEMQTPESRRFADMVDEVSLRDINRYQFMKNSTDEGIPVQRAGTDDAPRLSDEQRRVMARIDGSSSVVKTYEEQGARSINDEEEPGFFESLFDW